MATRPSPIAAAAHTDACVCHSGHGTPDNRGGESIAIVKNRHPLAYQKSPKPMAALLAAMENGEAWEGE